MVSYFETKSIVVLYVIAKASLRLLFRVAKHRRLCTDMFTIFSKHLSAFLPFVDSHFTLVFEGVGGRDSLASANELVPFETSRYATPP